MKTLQLRPYQLDAIEKLRNGIRAGYKNQLLCSATGSGKSVIAASLLDECAKKGNRAVFVCDRLSLINQTSALLDSYGIAHGVVQAQHPRWRPYERIQVCSAQTLARRQWPEANLIVIDECHTITETVKNRISARDTIAIGLTATPFTKGLGKLYDNLVNVTSTQTLIDEGFLSGYRIFACKEPDMEGVRVVAGEWEEKETSRRALEVVGDCVKEYVEHCNGKKFICSAVNTAHVEELQRQFMAAGILCANYTYKTSEEEREEIVNEFKKLDSVYRGLITVTAASKGFDCLDEKTEILTTEGWRGIGNVSTKNAVYAFNRETEKIEIVPILKYAERFVRPDEMMVTLKSQRFDIRVSEGHWFHFKSKKNRPEFESARAKEMVVRKADSFLPISGECDFKGVDLTDDEIRLIAWYVTDGNIHRTTFSIAQSKPFKHEIRELLARLHLDFKERDVVPHGFAHTMQSTIFEIPKGTHKGALKRNGWFRFEPFLKKNISPLLFGMTREQFRVFWNELLKGHGAKQEGKSGWLWCSSKGQADAIMHLACVRGFAASMLSQRTKSGKTVFLVSCRDKQFIQISPSSSLGAKFAFEVPKTGEKVWCVQNRLSTLVTRRNGRIAIVGNCPDIECVIMARPLRNSLAEHIQLFGRGLRIHPDKKECIVLDHSGNCLRFMDEMQDFFQHGAIELDDGKKKERKKKKTEDIEDKYMKCPHCRVLHAAAPYCPNCGHEYPPKKSEIIHKAGTLQELIASGTRQELTVELWPQIVRYSLEHKTPEKAEKFALAMFRNITGTWPLKKFCDTAPSEIITDYVRRKIKSLNIRYAKAVQARERSAA